MRLSEKCLKNIKPVEKTFKLFDGGGLYLEVTPQGGKRWRLKYRYGDKEKRISLGTYPLTSLKEAREKLYQAKKLLEQNIDPSVAKQEAKWQALKCSGATFETVANEWHETMKPKWTEAHAKSIKTRLETHIFPRMGKLPIKSIEAPTLLQILKQVEKSGEKGSIYETTKRVRQYISQVFRYAMITGRADRDITVGMADVFHPKKVKHHAALRIEDVPEFLKKLHANDARLYIQTRYALELMLLTFVRTSELTGARWNEIDWKGKVWNIPGERMKMGDPHIVPLSKQALDLLEQLKKLYGEGEFVLPSPVSPKKPLGDFTMINAMYRMEYRGVATVHGFRALAMTAILENLGYPFDVVDAQLAHAKRGSLGGAYDRAKYLKERTKMMQDWADFIDSLKTQKLRAA